MTVTTMQELLDKNSYPGRGILVGKSAGGEYAVCVYFIMGRSVHSRNRIFVKKGSELSIHPKDPSKVEDPSLIIYSPIRGWNDQLIVTNGDQTDTIYSFLQNGKTFEEALCTRTFEPDAPNFTPRISAVLHLKPDGFFYEMSILKSNGPQAEGCNRFFYRYQPVSGRGHFLHTYQSDGNPLPSFCGEPWNVSVPDSIEKLGDSIWEHMNTENKIALYVRYIHLKSGEMIDRLWNRFEEERSEKK